MRPIRRAPLRLWHWLAGLLVAAQQRFERHDDESYACYALFVALLVADMSLLSLVLPLSALLYALLDSKKPRAYWQVCEQWP